MGYGILIIVGVLALFAFIAPSYDNVYDAHRRVKNPNFRKKGKPSRKVKR